MTERKNLSREQSVIAILISFLLILYQGNGTTRRRKGIYPNPKDSNPKNSSNPEDSDPENPANPDPQNPTNPDSESPTNPEDSDPENPKNPKDSDTENPTNPEDSDTENPKNPEDSDPKADLGKEVICQKLFTDEENLRDDYLDYVLR